MHRTVVPFAAALFSAAAAPALAFEVVSDRERFIAIIDGRELRMGALGISLVVRPDGRIEGSAVGWPVTGNWSWDEGYFCREMDWSGTPVPFNCQLVEFDDAGRLRFTVDRGAGEAATFTLR